MIEPRLPQPMQRLDEWNAWPQLRTTPAPRHGVGIRDAVGIQCICESEFKGFIDFNEHIGEVIRVANMSHVAELIAELRHIRRQIVGRHPGYAGDHYLWTVQFNEASIANIDRALAGAPNPRASVEGQSVEPRPDLFTRSADGTYHRVR